MKVLWDVSRDMLCDLSVSRLYSSLNYSETSSDENDSDDLATQPIWRSAEQPPSYSVRSERVGDKEEDAFQNDPFLMDIVQPRLNIVTISSEHGK